MALQQERAVNCNSGYYKLLGFLATTAYNTIQNIVLSSKDNISKLRLIDTRTILLFTFGKFSIANVTITVTPITFLLYLPEM